MAGMTDAQLAVLLYQYAARLQAIVEEIGRESDIQQDDFQALLAFAEGMKKDSELLELASRAIKTATA